METLKRVGKETERQVILPYYFICLLPRYYNPHTKQCTVQRLRRISLYFILISRNKSSHSNPWDKDFANVLFMSIVL